MKDYYLYILKSEKNGHYYVGITSDLSKRLNTHNKGANLSTKSSRPWKIIYSETFKNKKEAWLRERHVKKYKGGQAFKKLVTNK